MTAYSFGSEVNDDGTFSAVLSADGKRFLRATYATYRGCRWLAPLASAEEAMAEGMSRWHYLIHGGRTLVIRADGEVEDDTDGWGPGASSFVRDLDEVAMLEVGRDD